MQLSKIRTVTASSKPSTVIDAQAFAYQESPMIFALLSSYEYDKHI